MGDIQKELRAMESSFSVGADRPLCGEVDFLAAGIEIENMQFVNHFRR
jgi:hypothetical protein